MNDTERLRRELRAAREELIRKRSQRTDETGPTASCLPLMPDREEEFLRLALVNRLGVKPGGLSVDSRSNCERQ